jgi:hypothetical protein
MPSFSKNEVILVRYPFSDLAAANDAYAELVVPAVPGLRPGFPAFAC